MPLDANLFTQGAQLRNQNAANLSAQLQNAVNLYASGQERKAKGLDVVKLAEASAYKKAAGLPITEEEDALAQGWDKIQSSSVALDPLGRPFRKQEPIFGAIAESSGSGYKPTYSNASPSDSPFPTGFQNGSMSDNQALDDMNQVKLSPAEIEAMTAETPAMKGLNLEALQPAKSVAEGLGGRLDPSNPEVLKADIETQKQINIDKQKIANEAAAKKAEVTRAEGDALPILKDMLKLNADTADIPYAGLAQPAVRIGEAVGATQKGKATAMDLLRQNQLDLAAPLAKQLGVNPTDKDFQSTLQRIFDPNSSKDSREKQIKNLITKIERRQGAQQGQTSTETQAQSPVQSYKDYFK